MELNALYNELAGGTLGGLSTMHPPQATNHVNSPASLLQSFWRSRLDGIEKIDPNQEFKTFLLPLARIKKVMKVDQDVKMISSEAPVIFAKACELFILELTLRSWIQTEDAKRRTLQRSDVAAAIAKNDTFDFLIDIVPRDERGRDPKKDELLFRQQAAMIIGNQSVPDYYFPNANGTATGLPQDHLVALQQQQQMQHFQQQQQMQQYMASQQQHLLSTQHPSFPPSETPQNEDTEPTFQ